jgi:hypothetical protein
MGVCVAVGVLPPGVTVNVTVGENVGVNAYNFPVKIKLIINTKPSIFLSIFFPHFLISVSFVPWHLNKSPTI